MSPPEIKPATFGSNRTFETAWLPGHMNLLRLKIFLYREVTRRASAGVSKLWKNQHAAIKCRRGSRNFRQRGSNFPKILTIKENWRRAENRRKNGGLWWFFPFCRRNLSTYKFFSVGHGLLYNYKPLSTQTHR